MSSQALGFYHLVTRWCSTSRQYAQHPHSIGCHEKRERDFFGDAKWTLAWSCTPTDTQSQSLIQVHIHMAVRQSIDPQNGWFQYFTWLNKWSLWCPNFDPWLYIGTPSQDFALRCHNTPPTFWSALVASVKDCFPRSSKLCFLMPLPNCSKEIFAVPESAIQNSNNGLQAEVSMRPFVEGHEFSFLASRYKFRPVFCLCRTKWVAQIFKSAAWGEANLPVRLPHSL